ncbi:unnamed protein product [Oikopleura dioica]|uniref:Uncharacterized protein n=1 Tax=Oikopleura dioica TaxID=34765 RepID=E4XCG0_OIKDI|nr:unnamed protein product [Oikopleura dioica]
MNKMVERGGPQISRRLGFCRFPRHKSRLLEVSRSYVTNCIMQDKKLIKQKLFEICKSKSFANSRLCGIGKVRKRIVKVKTQQMRV